MNQYLWIWLPESPSLRTCQLELNFEADPFNCQKSSFPLASFPTRWWCCNQSASNIGRLFLTYLITCRLFIWKLFDVLQMTSNFWRKFALFLWNILFNISVEIVDFLATVLHSTLFTSWNKLLLKLPKSPAWDKVKVVCMPFTKSAKFLLMICKATLELLLHFETVYLVISIISRFYMTII